MDGDGVVDCPYDFDDKTNHNSGGGYGYTRPTEEVKQETEEEKQEVKKEISRTKLGVLDVLEYLMYAALTWLSSSYFISLLSMFIFGKDQGCTIAMIAGVVVTIIAMVFLIR